MEYLQLFNGKSTRTTVFSIRKRTSEDTDLCKNEKNSDTFQINLSEAKFQKQTVGPKITGFKFLFQQSMPIDSPPFNDAKTKSLLSFVAEIETFSQELSNRKIHSGKNKKTLIHRFLSKLIIETMLMLSSDNFS